jgi:glycosyltransferase involved in cell wall biosynthesis
MFSKEVQINADTQIVFVSDFFVDDYVGGAELTTQALIDECKYKYVKIRSSEVTLSTIESGKNCYWIFGNFTQLNPQIIPAIVANLNYSVLEFDFKFCKFRLPELHVKQTGFCDCDQHVTGKVISAFLYGARSVFWMSEKQQEIYMQRFPFLLEKENIVISSIFSKDTLKLIKSLSNNQKNDTWVVLGSNSWVKGFENAEEYCKKNNLKYEVVWNIPYNDLLKKLSQSKGFVYLPNGSDTCPRMVIEAKLLGCDLILNEFVLHSNEQWFSNNEQIYDYLFASPNYFWTIIDSNMTYKASISGYTTVLNCNNQQYPFKQCIQSMLDFCDEVCVVDGGSTDGTYEELVEWANKEPKIVLKQVTRDWSSPRYAVFDGMQKAEARSMCTKEFCWQMDCDEIVHEKDYAKIFDMCKSLPHDIDVISLPVVEYWGSYEKVRVDIQPWKWRLSRNNPDITHGIPSELRKYDKEGNLFAMPGTDGCDMISKSSGERIPHLSFYRQEVEEARHAAMDGNQAALGAYNAWFNEVINNLPSVYHYSWFNLDRKIKLYKNYWTKHWLSLWNCDLDDTSENNMFFDMPWAEVTDDMIREKAEQLKQIGGWIFHKKWDGTVTPHIKVNVTPPKHAQEFFK